MVQVNPESDHGKDWFAGCYVTVTKIYSWGVQGYVQVPKEGPAYVRIRNENLKLIGQAQWVNSEGKND